MSVVGFVGLPLTGCGFVKEAKVVYVDALSAYAHQIGEAINYATKFDNKEKRDELHNKLMEFANAVKK